MRADLALRPNGRNDPHQHRGRRSPRDRSDPSARRTHDRHAPEPAPAYPSAAQDPVMNEPCDRRACTPLAT